MIPFVEPASKPRSSTWLDRLARIGNVDLMLAWEREGKEGYLGEGMVRQALEGAGGTVNTKILGEDSVSKRATGNVRGDNGAKDRGVPKPYENR